MTSQQNIAVWRDCIRAWYPDYETKTYFVPPVVITRIPFDVVKVAGQSVLVPQCNTTRACDVPSSSTQVKVSGVQVSDTRDDLALQGVLFCLRELLSGQSEPMFVISQLQFSSYLGEPYYAESAKQFTRPQNLSGEYKRGDFDILIIHRHFGIITGEIKSVLSLQESNLTLQDVDRMVTDRVRNAIKQLNKSEVVLREITKDLEPNLAISKLLILPYVTTNILMRVFSNNEQLKQELITCLQVVKFEQVLQRCLLAENLLFCGTKMANDQQPHTWWSTFSTINSEITLELYLDLLARFCGPATTVSVYCPTSPRIEIRTEGQGVAVTGKRMTSLVLTLEQISLLTRAPTKVWLNGPPGVGKSVMLVLMALTWLKQGNDVHLVSVWIPSLAVTRMIKYVIQESMRDDLTTPSIVGSVHLHEYYFYTRQTDIDDAINTLTATGGSHGPHIVCDEFWAYDSHIFARYQRFVTDLCTCLPNVCLWATSTRRDQRPAELQEERMTIPLRCPPTVLSEVEKGVNSHSGVVYPYTTTALATPCGRTNVIHLIHQGPVHTGRWPLECVKCGQSIAGILQRLGLGVTYFGVNNNTVTTSAITTNSHTNTAHANEKTACPSLQYRDVFVLTRSVDLRDDVKDEVGCVTSTANGVVRGLRDAGTPVRVIRQGHSSTDVFDTAVRQSDVVTVTHYGDVSGLKRKVVVCLPDRIPCVDDDWSDERIESNDRLYAMSRCTAQLVVVDVPRI